MANPHISAAEMTLSIECDDAYYKKFSEIKTEWTVNFSRFDYLTNVHWRYPMKTGHCREAIAMSINAAYMFSSQEYADKMKEYNGQFYGNGSGYGQPTSIDAVNDSTLYVSDMKSGKNVVVRLVMHKHEIREW
jgi:hypothetical protein